MTRGYWIHRVTWNGGHHTDYRDAIAAITAMRASPNVPSTLTVEWRTR